MDDQKTRRGGQRIDLFYEVDESARKTSHWFIYVGQWVATMVYPVVWGLAVVGIGLGLKGPELAEYMVSIVFMVAVTTAAQAWIGHRFAMVSGPNVIPSLAIVLAFATGGREYAQLAFLAQALASVAVVVLAATGIIGLVRRVWTPLVLGAMIMTIGLSVAPMGLQQMTSEGFGWPFWTMAVIAVGAAVLSVRGRGIWGTLAPLVVVAGGYIIFAAAGALNSELIREAPLLTWPRPFPFGFDLPPWDLVLTMFVVGLMSTLNLYGYVHGYAGLVGRKVTPGQERRSLVVLGVVENILPGIFGVPGYVPYAENLGIVASTRVAARKFILIAAMIFGIFAFIGPIAGLMAAIPLPVSGGVLLGIASTVIGLGAHTWSQVDFDRREVMIVSLSIFLAVGLYFLPGTAWEPVPHILRTIFSNPVISVIIFVILFEQVVFREPRSKADRKQKHGSPSQEAKGDTSAGRGSSSQTL